MFNPTGRRISGIRPMTKGEMKTMGWNKSIHGPPFAIDLDDGSTICGSSDPEMNRPGHLIAFTPAGEVAHVGGGADVEDVADSEEWLDGGHPWPVDVKAAAKWKAAPIRAVHIRVGLAGKRIAIKFPKAPTPEALAEFRSALPNSQWDGMLYYWTVNIRSLEAARRVVGLMDKLRW
jgi:hypothetical protein